MSIAFEMSTGGDPIQQRPAFRRKIKTYTAKKTPPVVEKSSSSSSIGKNSDEESGEGEVQSQYKGPLDCFDALQEVLPIKKSVSKFYNGKSKSFTSLADVVSCSNIKEIVKPENALTRKRKNLLAHALYFDKNSEFPPISCKKPTNSNRSTSTISSNGSNNSESSNASSPVLSRPPLHPHSKKSLHEELSSSPRRLNFSPWRSLSLSDLHGAAAATSTNSLVLSKTEEEKPH